MPAYSLAYKFSALLALGMHVATAEAEEMQKPWESTPPPHLVEDRVRLEVGAWQAGIDTLVRADATPTQLGSTLSGEQDLGLRQSRLMPEIELVLLPGERQLFRLNGFSSRRNGSALLTRTVQYDGNTYLVGQTVQSTLNLDMVGVGYAYRLFKAPRYELALGLDINVASVQVNAYVPRNGPREADTGVVPLPLIDVEGRVELWRKLQLLARYRTCCLGLEGDADVTGDITDWRVGLQWQFSQHLGVALHYRHFGVQVDAASGSHPGAVRLDHTGPQLVFRASL